MRSQKTEKKSRKRSGLRRLPLPFLCMALILCGGIGGTSAYLLATSSAKTNTFLPSKVTCQVEENFNGMTKSNVTVKNTGDTDAYIRVKLITYRVNEAGERIGGTAEIPEFTCGEGWIESGGFYYYRYPVKPGGTPEADLIDFINLTRYDDADGGKQVVEVMAEAIQSAPKDAVSDAWGNVADQLLETSSDDAPIVIDRN